MSLIVPANTAKVTPAHIPWQDVTNTNQVVGSDIVVNNGSTIRERSVRFLAKLGRRSGTAFTAGWPNVRFEASTTDSGNLDWFPLYTHVMAVGASIANTTLSAGASPGTSITVAAATNVGIGDTIFIAGNTAAENEIVRVRTAPGTTITLESGTPLVAAKNSGNQVTDQAEIVSFDFNCQTLRRVRAIVDNANGGQTVAVEVSHAFFDAEDIV